MYDCWDLGEAKKYVKAKINRLGSYLLWNNDQVSNDINVTNCRVKNKLPILT